MGVYIKGDLSQVRYFQKKNGTWEATILFDI
jgi:hypothetical protein